MDTIAGGHHEPIGCPGEFDGLIATAAAKYFVFAGHRHIGVRESDGWVRCKPVAAPFPNVAMHIIETPRIGAFLANGMGGAFAILQSPGVLIRLGSLVAKVEP